jgi:ATP-binding cassette subfamily F protein 3
MLSLRDVRVRRGSSLLIEHADLEIFAGEKVGIVGRNGCGKSSLLSLIRGELAPDGGDFSITPRLRISWVAQELPHSQAPLLEHVLDGDTELRELQAAIAAAEATGDGVHLSTLHAQYEHLGGYAAPSRAAQLATGLGFAPEDLERPIAEFSGGLQMRANLARALMRRSQLLLLDEPTNHLDLDALLWLEEWLRAYRGTLLIVSHDRELLDGVVQRIVHIESGAVRTYAGNYSAFETQQAATAQRVAALAERQRREAARIHAFVERFRAKASKARQAQSRLKRLARLEMAPAVHGQETFEWQFAPPPKLPRPLVVLDEVALGYGSAPVLTGVRLRIEPGDRIGVLGRNGAGKSTLMRSLAGELAPRAGTATSAPDLTVGFFAQRELERLAPDGTPVSELARCGGPAVALWGQQRARDHLGRFGFRGERVFDSIAQFSGGERARLALAILVARTPNLLLLDEPTNHLDFEMRHALTLALQDFAGAVVLVAHDRALLGAVCERFVLVAGGGVREFDGDLEDYARFLAAGAAAGGAQPSGRDAGLSRRAERHRDAQARNRLSGLKAEQRAIEQQLVQLGARRAALERALADPALYAQSDRAQQLQLAAEHAGLGAEIERAEARWLEVSETLDTAAAQVI